jgi:hypothetical protein
MRLGWAIALIGGICLGAVAHGAPAPATPAKNSPRVSSNGQVYIMRGLLGPVLSAGLETLAARLRARGIEAPVSGYESYGSLAAEALARYRAGNHGPIVIVGHSLGAISAMDMARALQAAHVPVSLIVTFGPIGDLQAPGNVAHVVNYYQSQGYSKGRVLGGPGFHGSISNVDLQSSPDINHVNMVATAHLQAQVIARIAALVGARAPSAAPSRSAANGAN